MGSPDVLFTAPDRALHLAGWAGRGHPPKNTRSHIFVPVTEPLPTQLEALRVLVADDDEATLRATRRLLERVGIMASPRRTRSNTWPRGPH